MYLCKMVRTMLLKSVCLSFGIVVRCGTFIIQLLKVYLKPRSHHANETELYAIFLMLFSSVQLVQCKRMSWCIGMQRVCRLEYD